MSIATRSSLICSLDLLGQLFPDVLGEIIEEGGRASHSAELNARSFLACYLTNHGLNRANFDECARRGALLLVHAGRCGVGSFLVHNVVQLGRLFCLEGHLHFVLSYLIADAQGGQHGAETKE